VASLQTFETVRVFDPPCMYGGKIYGCIYAKPESDMRLSVSIHRLDWFR